MNVHTYRTEHQQLILLHHNSIQRLIAVLPSSHLINDGTHAMYALHVALLRVEMQLQHASRQLVAERSELAEILCHTRKMTYMPGESNGRAMMSKNASSSPFSHTCKFSSLISRLCIDDTCHILRCVDVVEKYTVQIDEHLHHNQSTEKRACTVNERVCTRKALSSSTSMTYRCLLM